MNQQALQYLKDTEAKLTARGVIAGASVCWKNELGGDRFGCFVRLKNAARAENIASNATVFIHPDRLQPCHDVSDPVSADQRATYGGVSGS